MNSIPNDVYSDQLVKVPTWLRTVNGFHRESLLDHVYCNNPLNVNNLHKIEPVCGYHCVIVFTENHEKPPPNYLYIRKYNICNKQNL
jgi:galactose-1-phosphate uridylyltransferase